MNLNKVVFRFVSISFSILVILLVLIGFVKIGTYCYDFGYRVFTEAPVDAEPGRDVIGCLFSCLFSCLFGSACDRLRVICRTLLRFCCHKHHHISRCHGRIQCIDAGMKPAVVGRHF